MTRRRNSLLAASLVLVLSLACWSWVSVTISGHLRANDKAELRQILMARGQALNSALLRRENAMEGMQIYLETELAHSGGQADPQEWRRYAAMLRKTLPDIEQVIIAPGGTVDILEPLGPGQPAGHADLLNHPQPAERDAVQRAIAHRVTTLGAPRRMPGSAHESITMHRAIWHEGRLWGLAGLRLNMNSLWHEALFNVPSPLDFVVRDCHGRIVFGDPQVIGGPGMRLPLPIDEGTWMLFGAPNGTETGVVEKSTMVLNAGCALIVLLLTALTYLLVNRQSTLNETVYARTRELREELSERRRVEAELRASQDRLARILEITEDGIWEANIKDGRYIQSDRFLAMHGVYDPAEPFTPADWEAQIHPEDRQATLEKIQSHLRGETPGYQAEYRLLSRDGIQRWVMVRGRVTARDEQGNPLYAMGTLVDITRIKQSEDRLRAYTHLIQYIIKHDPNAIAVLDRDMRYVMVSDRFLNDYGLGISDVIGKCHYEIFPEVDEHLRQVHQRCMLGAVERNEDERFVRQDGSIDYVRWECRPWHAPDGTIGGIVLYTEVVTERKQAELRLRESEAKFRAIFDESGIGKALLNAQGRIVHANHALKRALGFEGDALESMMLSDLFAPEHVAEASAEHERLLRGESNRVRLVTLLTRADGHLLWGRVTSTIVRAAARDAGSQPPMIICMIEDITEQKEAEAERRRLETQIQHAQKLESLGVLAGGIAHDFNNLLMGVLGYADLALIDLESDAPARQSVQQIEIAARRAAELVSQMLAYSGRGKFVIQRINLARLVEEMTHLLRISISKKVTLKYNFAEDLPMVEADASQLRQVVMNLITNASEAIGDQNGEITISGGAIEADEAYLGTMFVDDHLDPGPYVYLDVSDTGCGMDEETMARIFDPFYTTKFTGRGLGLAAVLGIARGHKGGIKVTSEVGRGTTFRVLLPSIEHEAAPARTEPESSRDWKGSGLILVVDDEQTVRNVARKMLEHAGFQVALASDGREGVEAFEQHKDEIEAVLLDMTMPNMNGLEAFRAIRRIRPDARVVLSSGYSEQDARAQFEGHGLAGFIQKPYRFSTLIKVLSGTLNCETGLSADTDSLSQ